jgi:hypothetical protein
LQGGPKRSRHSRFFSVAIIIGCAGFSQAASADQAADFKQDLAQGYSGSRGAGGSAHDSAGQSYFQNKSDRARALYKVDPEWPTNWWSRPIYEDHDARSTDPGCGADNPKAGHDPRPKPWLK